MEKQKIVRVTDSEIVAHGMDIGQRVFASLLKTDFAPGAIDSIARRNGVKIKFLVPGAHNALVVEQELIDAYVNGIAAGGAGQENLQKLWTDAEKNQYDSLVYSQPKLTKRPDGVEELQGIWNIYIAKKNIVLDIGKDK